MQLIFGSFRFVLTLSLAVTVEVERMVCDLKLHEFTHHIFDILDSWVAKLQDIAAIDTDDMIMLSIAIGFFEISRILAELVFFDKVAFD